jgi:hypothetical protein
MLLHIVYFHWLTDSSHCVSAPGNKNTGVYYSIVQYTCMSDRTVAYACEALTVQSLLLWLCLQAEPSQQLRV